MNSDNFAYFPLNAMLTIIGFYTYYKISKKFGYKLSFDGFV
ncbi:hypothetical protein OAO42_00795 [Candidatus Izimaplasma bacterium]|nr:hypothetical protein [Candidatus Izimaplasma bacterium]